MTGRNLPRRLPSLAGDSLEATRSRDQMGISELAPLDAVGKVKGLRMLFALLLLKIFFLRD